MHFLPTAFTTVFSTKLAKVANLKVISHNSVAKYRGARNTQEIGRALNVAYVLEGSVRREAGRIHLNAQLIDTRTDAHVWAQEYDRNLNDVFTLQSEIAQKIADQLGAEVSSTEKAAIQEPPTTDLVAYDSYLRAKDLIDGISFSTRQKKICSKRCNCSTRQSPATHCSFWLMPSSLARTTEFISSVSITLRLV